MSFARFLKKIGRPELKTAITAALASGCNVKSNFKKAGQKDYKSKNLGDLVTEVDITSEKIIISHLGSAGVTEARIISEETLSTNGNRQGDLWIVDPLDSTIGFVYGLPSFSVIIAYSLDGIIQIGVVYFPVSDELFFAVLNQGCWYLNQGISSNLEKMPERVSLIDPCIDLTRARVVLNKHAVVKKESQEMRRLENGLRTDPIPGLLTSEVPNSGIACRVASGHIGAAIHDNSEASKKQRCWDMAAPKLIVEEAGGCFCNFNGNPINIWEFEPIIVSQSKQLRDQILEKLNS